MTEESVRRTPRRRGRGDELRREIVQAAADEIARSGDAATLSLRGVARAVGIATTSIYLHFATLDELVDEVKATLFAELEQDVGSAAERAGADPLARVRAVGHAYLDWAAQRPGDYLVMFTAVIGRPGSHPGGVAALQHLSREVRGALGQDDESWMVAIQLWTALHGSVVLRLGRPSLPWPDVHDQADDLVDRLLTPRK